VATDRAANLLAHLEDEIDEMIDLLDGMKKPPS
jgi:hypothetical protein